MRTFATETRVIEGFTLIELLIVIIIIGILAAIAIPMFLGQRDKAKESAVKGGVHNIELGIGSYAVDHGDRIRPTDGVDAHGARWRATSTTGRRIRGPAPTWPTGHGPRATTCTRGSRPEHLHARRARAAAAPQSSASHEAGRRVTDSRARCASAIFTRPSTSAFAGRRSTSSKGSTSRSTPTTCSACSGPTAPARRPPSRSRWGSCGPRPARSSWASRASRTSATCRRTRTSTTTSPGASSSGSARGCSGSTRARRRERVEALLRDVGLRARGRHAPAQVLQGHAAARRHRPGAHQRPRAGAARRADDRPRPGRAASRSSASSRACTSAARRCSSTRTSSATCTSCARASPSCATAASRGPGTVDEALAEAPTLEDFFMQVVTA